MACPIPQGGHNKYQLSLTTRATRYITANMLQTKTDAQCHTLATELSSPRLRRLTFSSYGELFAESRRQF